MKLSISREGVEIGEWNEDEVRALHQQGQLKANDLYWKEGMAQWLPLGTFLKPPLPTSKGSIPGPMKGFNRLKFLGGFCIALGAVFFVALVMSAFGVTEHELGMVVAVMIYGSIVVLSGNRLVNIGYPAWYCLLCFLPLINVGMLIICVLAPPGYAQAKGGSPL